MKLIAMGFTVKIIFTCILMLCFSVSCDVMLVCGECISACLRGVLRKRAVCESVADI